MKFIHYLLSIIISIMLLPYVIAQTVSHPAEEITPGTYATGGDFTFPDNLVVIGNVGIGTSSPSEKLEVIGNIKGTQLCIGTDCRSTWPSGGDTDWTISGTNMFSGVTGNVGIGTSSPGEKLEVIGNVEVTTAFMGTGGHGATYAHFSHPNYKGAGQYALLQHGTAGHTYLNSVGTGDLYFRNDNANQMVILDTGNVGIGTTSPARKFHVFQSATTYPARVQSAGGYLDFGPANTGWSHFSTDRPRFWFNKGVTVDTGNIGSYNENLNLQTSGTTRITVLNSGGNVGIGTTGPTQRLDVNGQIRIRGGSPGSGRVLTSDSSGVGTWQTPGGGGHVSGGLYGTGVWNWFTCSASSPMIGGSSGCSCPGGYSLRKTGSTESGQSASTTHTYYTCRKS